MKNQLINKLLLSTSLIASMACAVSAFAQTPPPAAVADEPVPATITLDKAKKKADKKSANKKSNDSDEVVVTGSRIKRDTFSSISPLQVITTDLSQDAGLFDPATILQNSESASGQQIDATFQGFVLDNGPGSQTLNLRGLGASRTLLLINGRRMAPAGVEGAPTSPSINLLPSSLVERTELLLDGASSVYGSDAIAGVVNVILKKDFEGFEVSAQTDYNPRGAGNDHTISGSWGKNTDRAFFGVGAEYRLREAIRLKDRDFLSGCNTHYEITPSGEIRTIDKRSNATVQKRTPGVSVSESPCKIQGISGRIYIPHTNYGSVYYTKGAGNTGIPGFNESTLNDVDVDANGDGIRDVDFQDVNTNASNLDRTIISEQKLYNLMAYGEYTFEGEANLTPFFEANYTLAKVNSPNAGAYQISPYVPAENVFNPCFRGTGVDCRAAENTAFGTGLTGGFDLPVAPIVSVKGDRNNVRTKQQQYRFVGGLKGDLPFLNKGPLNNWAFEAAGVYSEAVGQSFRKGIREDKLAFALGIDPTADFNKDGVTDNNGDGIADDYNPNLKIGGIFGGPVIAPCDVSALANPEQAMDDLAQGCVPVNLFAPSLLGKAIGDFATAAERDYVFGESKFDTNYQQILLSAYATGNVYELPAGQVAMVVGAEWRKDKINSMPSAVASNGLFIYFASDKGAVGSKTIKEVFAELDIPIVADKPFFRELGVNVSGRITDEEYYGTAATYAIKGGWRPFDSLQLKASFGTSYRAPNLRENFLAGSTGFRTLRDPCAVPEEAFVRKKGAKKGDKKFYNAALDEREATTLANCIREGRDPTRVGIGEQGLNTSSSTSVEIKTGGSLALNEETSEALTVGFAFDQPFFDSFDFNLNVNYFDIKTKGAIVKPNSQFILNDCYTRKKKTRSVFCDRIKASTSADDNFLVSHINSNFINLNQETIKGLDINAALGKEIIAFQKNVDLKLKLRVNRIFERNSLYIGADGTKNLSKYAGNFGIPKWTGNASISADIDKFRFSWFARYIGNVRQKTEYLDKFNDAFGNEHPKLEKSDTCLGTAASDTLCRDVGFADSYMVHSASIRYRTDTHTLRIGVTNIFDRDPPLVDSNEIFSVSNVPIGNGYDLNGREFFVAVSKKF
ncbi:MAG: TonB-dependent receptor [Robiginitomaculum sp.]